MPLQKFPFYKGLDNTDCGPSCLRMIAKHYGRTFSLQYLRDKSFATREGVSLLGLSETAEAVGMRSLAVRTSFEKLQEEVPLPCIAHWKQNHFIVVHKLAKDKVHVADPAHGLLTYTPEEFKKNWASFHENGKGEGVLLLLEPHRNFTNRRKAVD
jgi:ATP-binding cassette subfamily B protein